MIEFKNDDVAYLDWINANENGWVINLRMGTSHGYAVLHRAKCELISDRERYNLGAYTERGYRKVCASTRVGLKSFLTSGNGTDDDFSSICRCCS